MALSAATVFGYSHDQALKEGHHIVDSFMATLKADSFTLALSDRSSRYFRHNILPSYKQHRAQGIPPLGTDDAKDILTEHFEAMILPGLEADDVVGILATIPDHIDEIVIVSDDKDLKTIPGHLYIPRLDKTVFITHDEAEYNHMYQTLTGDTCDGFKGCPRIGPVKASAMLDLSTATCVDGCGLDQPAVLSRWRWEKVVRAYEAKGLTESDALIQARVARIVRASEWNAQTNTVTLWSPPE